MIITILGWICAVALCIAAAGFSISLAADLVRRAFERFEWAIVAKTTHNCGLLLRSAAYWFSESKEAYALLITLSDRLIKGYGIDESQWRDEWRNRLSSKPHFPQDNAGN